MPVLLLAQGDQAAKEILRNAIATRYGIRPPILESIRLDFRGRVNAQTGDIPTLIPLDATALFRFPNAMRWNLTVRPPRVEAERTIESYDGEAIYYTPHNKTTRTVSDPRQIHSMTQRLWALAAALLTPLNDINVHVKLGGRRRVIASHRFLGDSTALIFNNEGQLTRVQTKCLNPETEQLQLYTIQLSENTVEIDGLPLPDRLRIYWDKQPTFELIPYAAASELVIPDSIFRAAYEGNTIVRGAQA